MNIGFFKAGILLLMHWVIFLHAMDEKEKELVRVPVISNQLCERFNASTIFAQGDVKAENNAQQDKPSLLDLPSEILVSCAITNDLPTTIKNLILLNSLSHNYKNAIRTALQMEACVHTISTKFNANPVSIAVILGISNKIEYRCERSRLKNIDDVPQGIYVGKVKDHDKETIRKNIIRDNRNREMQRCTEATDLSGLIALLKYNFPLYEYYFIKGNCKDTREVLEFLYKVYCKREDIVIMGRRCILSRLIACGCSLDLIKRYIGDDEGFKCNPVSWQLHRVVDCGRRDIMQLFVEEYDLSISSDDWVRMFASVSHTIATTYRKKGRQLKRGDYIKLAKYILQQDVNISKNHNYLLQRAVCCLCRKSVKWLLEREVDASTVKDRENDRRLALECVKIKLKSLEKSKEHNNRLDAKIAACNSIITVLETHQAEQTKEIP